MNRMALSFWVLSIASAPAFAGDAAKPARIDLYGDPLPDGALARLGTSRLRHGGPVQVMALSPDGKLLATAGGSGGVRVFEVASGKQLHELRGQFVVTALLFAPDGKTLLTADPSGTIRVWDLKIGAEVRRFSGSGDNFELAANRMIGFARGRVACMIFSRDERTLWVADGETIYQWLPSAGLDLRKISPGAGRILAISQSADGKKLHAAVSDGSVRIWDLDKNQEERRFPIPVSNLRPGMPNELVTTFSPDGRYLAVLGMNLPLQIYDVQSGELGPSETSLGRPVAVAFAANGKTLATASPAGGVTLFGMASNRPLRQFEVPMTSTTRAHLAFSANGKVLAFAAGDQVVRLWDVVSSTELSAAGGHEAGLLSMTFAADGTSILSTSMDRTVRLWDPLTGKQLGLLGRGEGKQVVPGGVSFPHAVVADPDGKGFFVAGEGLFYRIAWDGKNLRDERRADGVRDYGGLPTGSAKVWFAQRSAKSVKVVDGRTGTLISSFGKIGDPIMRANAIALSPDGELLATGGTGAPVQIWRTRTGRLVRTMAATQKITDFGQLLFSRDGRTLLGAGGYIQLWEVASGQERLQFSLNQIGTQRGFAFSPNSRAILMGGFNGSIFFFDALTGHVVDEWAGHRGPVACLEFSPDGKKLASGSNDCTALIWDATRIDHKLARAKADLHTDELEVLWKVLADPDAARAYRAIAAFASAPEQSVPFIAKRLSLADALDAKLIAKWVADIDSPQFASRQRALKELERFEDAAEDALLKALANNPSLELQTRVTDLLSRLSAPTPQKLQIIRALEILEHAGTSAARDVFIRLAGGPADHWLTNMARQSLGRLDRFASRD